MTGLRTTAAAILCSAALLGGCTEFSDHRAGLAQTFAAGRFDIAAKELDDPTVSKMYGSKNRLLYELDRGSIAFAQGDYNKCIELLNTAEDRIELQRKQSVGDTIGQWTINDTTATYVAEPYEDMYTNVIKIMAQLGANNISGGATVEARRIGTKADVLRDTYLKYKDQVDKESSKKLGNQSNSGGLVTTNDEGQFVESPLGTYLAAITFMKSGDPELQRVAGKRLIESIKLQSSLIGPVNEENFKGLDEKRPDSVNFLAIALSGRGPTKYAERIGPIPIGTVPIYFELPKLRTSLSSVTSARVEVEGQQLDGDLKFIEDMAAVATENHQRMLPLVYTRTLIRAAIKAGVSATLTEVARKNARDRNQGLVQVAGVVAGLVFMATTERADLRSWIYLPGQARVGAFKLTPGEHRVRIVFQSASGGAVYSSEWKAITVADRDLSSIVVQYWN